METAELAPAGTITHYVVQAFKKGARGKLQADEPRIARDREHCKVMAERISFTRHSVIAFSRTGDPDTGDFDEPVILAKFGEVPEI